MAAVCSSSNAIEGCKPSVLDVSTSDSTSLLASKLMLFGVVLACDTLDPLDELSTEDCSAVDA